jgi:hypothetical protein
METFPKYDSQEYVVTDSKDPNQKQLGEKKPEKFQFNPGNMAGKTAGTDKDESEKSNAGRMHSRHEQQDKNKKSGDS